VRIWVVSLAVIIAVSLLASVAPASDTFWFARVRLYTGAIGGSPMDPNQIFGVRPNATDDYDQRFDSPKAPEPIVPAYVYLSWYRTGWARYTNSYLSDYRAPVKAGQTKVWQDLRAKSKKSARLFMDWKLGPEGRPELVPPLDYKFMIYDEGTSPNPTGGNSLDMGKKTFLSFNYEAGQVRYFHIAVTVPPGDRPPLCYITHSPTRVAVKQWVAFDSHVSVSNRAVVKVSWDFGDGGKATGAKVTHTYKKAGRYTVTAKATDKRGATGTCRLTVRCE